MQRAFAWMIRHRNACLVVLSLLTLAATLLQDKQDDAPASVSIPVMAASGDEAVPVAAYLRKRDADALRDMAALEALIAREDVSAEIRNAAADQLRGMAAARQAQTAIEGALINSSLYPCAAVISNGVLTLVTGKSAVTEKDSALVIALAALHAGLSAEKVCILTAE